MLSGIPIGQGGILINTGLIPGTPKETDNTGRVA